MTDGEPRTLRVVVPGRPPSPNVRQIPQAAARVRGEWLEKAYTATKAALAQAGWPTEVRTITRRGRKKDTVEERLQATTPMARAMVVVAIVVPDQRERDWDNGVASLKPCFDALVLAGVVAGDSTTHIPERTVAFAYRPGLSQVILDVTEIFPEGQLGL